MVRKKVEEDVEEEEILEEDEVEEELEDLEADEEDADSDEETEADDEEELEDEAEEPEDEEKYQMEEDGDEDEEAAPSDRMSGLAADVPVQVVAVLGKRSFTMQDLMDFHVGQVVDLYRPANETVDLVVGGKLIAKGELVSIDGKLGVKIVKLI